MALSASSATEQIEGIKTTLASLLEADRKDEALDLFVSVLSQPPPTTTSSSISFG